MKAKSVFCCAECGYETAKWLGKCPSCGAWNTLKEMKEANIVAKSGRYSSPVVRPMTLEEISTDRSERLSTGIQELDSVLGGGLVCGSLVLVGGEPGIGKSTLLMEVCQRLAEGGQVLYISGEESEMQLKMRAMRLGVTTDKLLILPQTDIDRAFDCIDEFSPRVCIVDSIQTMFSDSVEASGGSVSQVREVTLRIMRKAKETGTAFFIVGHVTKEGNIAGPRLLEHMVDCVLYFEGDRNQSYRVLRAVKNRFGSTNEVGVFEMTGKGLIGVENPSTALLSGRPAMAAGSAVTCLMEGSRPLLAEIQALTAPTGFGVPRRASQGMDYNRLVLLLAIIEKKLGIPMQNQDVYVNVIGGLRVDETCADLAVICAAVSSVKNRALQSDMVFLGEAGLAGEIRAVSNIQRRVAEAVQLGFRKCVLPKANFKAASEVADVTLIPVETITDVLREDIYL